MVESDTPCFESLTLIHSENSILLTTKGEGVGFRLKSLSTYYIEVYLIKIRAKKIGTHKI